MLSYRKMKQVLKTIAHLNAEVADLIKIATNLEVKLKMEVLVNENDAYCFSD